MKQPRDFGCGRFGARVGRVAGYQTQGIVCLNAVDRELILLAVEKRITTTIRFLDIPRDIVDERQQRGKRSKAPRDRPPRVAFRAQRLDVPPRIVEDGDVGVAERINGLLAVADDEDRGRERARGRETGALAPRLDEQ